MHGVVTRSQSGFYTVVTENSSIVCQLRGRLKKGQRVGDVIAVGDKVEFSILEERTGVIEEVLPRKSLFARMDPMPRGVYQQILIANPDQAVFVFACAEPEPHLGMLDRFLVIAESQHIPAVVVANKTDLVRMADARELFGHYSGLGYSLVYTSAQSGKGVHQLKKILNKRISLLTGPSGAGKSTLLNRIQPDLDITVREVSQVTSKGRHTTVVREMYALDGGGYVADTPGLKALAFFDVEPVEMDGYFPEMRNLVENCLFNDCTHIHEPGCAVIEAIEKGKIHPSRYNSYLRMRLGDEGLA